MKINRENKGEIIVTIENLLEEQKFDILMEWMDKCNLETLEKINRDYINVKKIKEHTRVILTKENGEYVLKET